MAKGTFRANMLLKLAVEKDQRTVPQFEVSGRIKYLFKTFFGKMMDVTKTNVIFAFIFALPLLFLCFIFPSLINNWTINTYNFIGNFGIGYPGVSDDLAVALADKYFYYRTYLFPCLAPSVILLFVGFAGLFHCARGLMWGEKVKPAKSFFNGIKKLWKPFLITGVIVAGILEGILYGCLWHIELMQLGQATVGGWFLFVFLLLVALIVVLLLIFLLPTFACYRFSYLKSLKNASILCLVMIPTTLFVAAFTIGVIMISSIGSVIGLIIMTMLVWVGFYFFAATWTNYAQYCFDGFIVPQSEGKTFVNAIKEKDEKTSKSKKKGGYVGAVSEKPASEQKNKKHNNHKNQNQHVKYKRKK